MNSSYGIIILALTRVGLRFFDRVEPRENPSKHAIRACQQAFQLLAGGSTLAGDIAIIASSLVFMGAAIPFIPPVPGATLRLSHR